LDVLDTDNASDTFIHDTGLGTTRLACFDLMGDKISGGCQNFSLACAGGAIAFKTYQSGLAAGDDTSAVTDIYVGLPFVGNAHHLITVNTFGVASNVDALINPSLSCDGRRVAFSTTYSLFPNDPAGTPDTFVSDVVSGQVFRIFDNSGLPVGLTTPTFSPNGGWLTLQSFNSLDPVDTGSKEDVYLLNFNLSTPGAIALISQNNGASSNLGAEFAKVSNAGHVVFSSNSTNLSQIMDTNGHKDIFSFRLSDVLFANGFE